MKRHGNGPVGARLLAVILSLVLGIAASGAAAEPGHGAPADGIKVHGDWTIEIRNPDGSLASRHEFKNALIPTSGSTLLAGLLGNFFEDITWGIRLWGDPDPCGEFGQGRDPCRIGQPPLVVTLPMTSGYPSSGTLELAGSVTIGEDSLLSDVNTVWSAQIRGTPNRIENAQFSARSINIQVRQGQIVQVKVVFSFS